MKGEKRRGDFRRGGGANHRKKQKERERRRREVNTCQERKAPGLFVIAQMYTHNLPFIKAHVLRDMTLLFFFHTVLKPG